MQSVEAGPGNISIDRLHALKLVRVVIMKDEGSSTSPLTG